MERRFVALLIVGVTAVSFSAVLVREADAPSIAIAFYRCAGAVFAVIYVLLGRSLRQELSLVTYSSIVYATSAVALAATMVASRTAFVGYPAKTWLMFALITAGPQFLGHTTFNYLLGHVRASVIAVALL